VANLPPPIVGYSPYAPGQQTTKFDGNVGLQTDLYIHYDGTVKATQTIKNNTEFPFNTGNAFEARLMP
jgi:hypothetical protein